MSRVYQDRTEAGEVLADRLAGLANKPDVIVLGLVRGGVLVAAAIADRLNLPLDVLVVRKLGVPFAPEVAFGAMGPGGVKVLNEQLADRLDPDEINQVVQRETAELQRREELYRAGRGPLDLTGRTAVIADDGLATGATARAAVAVARQMGAKRVVVAVPVGSPDAYGMLAAEADEVICPDRPADFAAVGQYYVDFHEVSDEEVTETLSAATSARRPG
ncbi:MAG TPA: phosphoribosyltransferase family protein [Micromonosporaceae bacterium]|nr:phosphoribosyltransferase family protein [Micromonosporaceae bacterium]